jgi:hypothetical protein
VGISLQNVQPANDDQIITTVAALNELGAQYQSKECAAKARRLYCDQGEYCSGCPEYSRKRCFSGQKRETLRSRNSPDGEGIVRRAVYPRGKRESDLIPAHLRQVLGAACEMCIASHGVGQSIG